MDRKPAVWIAKVRSVAPDAFEPILWGLEEEGIPFEILETDDGPVPALAKRAANGSPLDVGIAIGGGGEVVLHHHDLPDETPLFSLETGASHPLRLRFLGANAARLAKGQPLLFPGQPALHAANTSAEDLSEDALEDLIVRICDEILKAQGASHSGKR